jgi:hypothetical protein
MNFYRCMLAAAGIRPGPVPPRRVRAARDPNPGLRHILTSRQRSQSRVHRFSKSIRADSTTGAYLVWIIALVIVVVGLLLLVHYVVPF